ncbi:DUF4097 family beta strand repeat-containing protein [Actinomadura atramentaria]|uniref:DUF4097 family beta strand repeat-containing protein n=1 Tax=Actinomadura atramentaria TaxID=1990 RepID=UPI00038199E3|nr:DUF4097 family beta strand repeat-containing protein [Actinomadura atramentaria]
MKTRAGAGLVVLAVAVSGCGLVTTGGKKHADRSYDVAGTDRGLTVRTNGTVEVVGADTAKVTVHERSFWTNDKNKPQATHTVRDGVLTLSARCRTQFVMGGSCGVKYRVTVPRALAVTVHGQNGGLRVSGTTAPVDVRTDTGSISLVDVTGPSLRARTNSGGLVVSGRTGSADLNTDTGSIDAKALEATSVTASTGSGAIRLSGRVGRVNVRTDTGPVIGENLTAPRVSARTSAGTVRLTFAVAPDNVLARTDTGAVAVALPADTPYAIETATDTGRTHLDRAVHRDSTAPRHLNLRTNAGPITVEPT